MCLFSIFQCALVNARLSDEITVSGDGQGLFDKLLFSVPSFSILCS